MKRQTARKLIGRPMMLPVIAVLLGAVVAAVVLRQSRPSVVAEEVAA